MPLPFRWIWRVVLVKSDMQSLPQIGLATRQSKTPNYFPCSKIFAVRGERM
ncbi:MAG: hypothetical protein ACK4I8_11690 [Armatimonadota bacterium]